jgi:ATP-dependent RNA helicase DHX57
MGKSKNQKGKGAKSAAPRCACDHPFNCGCGNRPPRPSRGHKWYPETQEWAGKGHKQKGASGQTALLSKEAKITDTGKTKIEQWQRLPSQLLKEICKKQRRPPPKFKEIKERDNKLKVRVIVNDAKGDDKKDLILIPSQSVGNEEQAKEEAALLALLQLTPTLPHERKLPEPYKTTWLAAIQATKGNSSSFKPKSNSNTTTTNNNTTATATRTRGASSNTNLTVGNVFRSHADKRRMQVQARQKRNARMARHEAIRMANRNHSVFLSAALRKQIQSLLQGTFVEEEIYEEDLPELALPESDCQFYIEERLHQEGFTKHQARRAYNSLNSAKDSTEELWEGLYDECLQFLLIHLKEDQVPEGLDPRNATLEVITTTVKKKKAALSPLSQKFANDYGLLREDAVWLEAKATEQNNMQETFWNSLCTLANVNLELKTASYSDQEGNIQLFQDEMEAMEAIFPDSCSLTENNDNLQTLTLQTPEEMTMELVLEKGKYPSTLPHRLFIKGKWPSPDMGLAVHVALVQYMAEELLERVGEPMVFELFGQLQLLLSSPLEELPILSLSSSSSSDNKNIQPKHTQASASNEESVSTATNNNTKKKLPALPRRPRARGDFWSSSNTPPAISMPNISKALKQQRNSLPAYKAKGDFLQCMKQAEESNSRVVLVTGDSKCINCVFFICHFQVPTKRHFLSISVISKKKL